MAYAVKTGSTNGICCGAKSVEIGGGGLLGCLGLCPCSCGGRDIPNSNLGVLLDFYE
jgi:hypothetical protein